MTDLPAVILRDNAQRVLDSTTTKADRNKLGQHATPSGLAREILSCSGSMLQDSNPIRFLDPGFGTGSFYSALLSTFPSSQITEAVGY